MAKVYLSRRVTFSASHRLHSAKMSESENQKIFGLCNNPNGHGHNYTLEVLIAGEVDSKTGMVFSLGELKQILAQHIEARFDHKHLNLDVPEFKELNPTAENMVLVFWRILEKALPKGLLSELRLHETENNIAVYRGE